MQSQSSRLSVRAASSGALPFVMTHSRTSVSLAQVTSASIISKYYLDQHTPKYFRRLKVFSDVTPANLAKHYHEHLNKTYTNPRSILRLYRKYSKTTDYPDYNWLLRCFTQLSNTFGFNSFWSTRDKQVIQQIPTFKKLMFDIVERKEQIHPRFVPRLLYAMAAIEYRCWPLMPTLLDHVEANMHKWRLPVLANMTLSLAYLGVGDNSKGTNAFGRADAPSKDYTGLIQRMCEEIHRRAVEIEAAGGAVDPCMTAFDWSGLAFAMSMTNLYDCPTPETSPLPYFLNRACQTVGKNLENSGWVQFFLYSTLYACDVEKPACEIAIKKAVPIEMQQQLHLKWLDGVVLHAQPQGSEQLQMEFDEVLRRLRVPDALINCSAGRKWDEQHCWFTGHSIKSRNLALEYNYCMPIGPGRPKLNGWLAMKTRMLNHFGINVAHVHRCYWDTLSDDQKDVMAGKLLSRFKRIAKPEKPNYPQYDEDKNLDNEARKSKKQPWPIQIIVK